MGYLLIFTKDKASHLKQVDSVLRRLEENKLFQAPEKCEVMKTEIGFLGFLVSKDGLRVNP